MRSRCSSMVRPSRHSTSTSSIPASIARATSTEPLPRFVARIGFDVASRNARKSYGRAPNASKRTSTTSCRSVSARIAEIAASGVSSWIVTIRRMTREANWRVARCQESASARAPPPLSAYRPHRATCSRDSRASESASDAAPTRADVPPRAAAVRC